MTESKAMILGCSGLTLTQEEIALYKAEQPGVSFSSVVILVTRSRLPIWWLPCVRRSVARTRRF